MNNVDLKQANKVHFIGIGGIGVSAIARMMLYAGKEVTGSDASESKLLDDLRDLGAQVWVGHTADHIADDVDVVVYTIAVPPENPELQKARKLEIPTLTYPEALGVISQEKKTVAVAGTHGKTTTTAMLAKIAEESGIIDPTVIVGSLLSDSNSNFVHGDSEWLIVEACEYKRSFLYLSPDILIITNIDNDHLDYFNGIEDIQDALSELAKKVPEDGAVVCNPAGLHMQPVVEHLDTHVIDYTAVPTDFGLQIPGDHNITNAQAAIAAADKMGVPQKKSVRYIESFEGTWRRAEYKGETKSGAVVYDDYAHHPTEIKATLAGFRDKFSDKRIIAVFQPHLFSRTKLLLDDFPPAFKAADEVIVLPIYAARETPDPDVTSEMLVEQLHSAGISVHGAEDFDAAAERVRRNADDKTLVITMGAGDVYKVCDRIADTHGRDADERRKRKSLRLGRK